MVRQLAVLDIHFCRILFFSSARICKCIFCDQAHVWKLEFGFVLVFYCEEGFAANGVVAFGYLYFVYALALQL